ncbi:NfeD family protein [Sphingomonas sp. HITSZ_GF]|uniref:NfeD family protein n=1 Tax=Sphingomonas sp. HITSZ_GF TaxID=3037247 RepID=UPI00240E9A1E|nr:NfeD family protein [Sphingomonas sp. HITSZ_GF]MDG2532707.1 NfeD family protein [Sphingomonas sp. HITSZ_GF]
MNLNELLAVPGLAWLILAALLAIAELLAPGIFLVFIAAGAAVTGIVTLLVPNFDLMFEVFLFAASSAAAVAVGRRWYRRNPVPSEDPLLNDRVARLIGQVVTVVEPIASGQGRVKVGDGEWLANGPDAPAGAKVRITGARGGSLDVEPA